MVYIILFLLLPIRRFECSMHQLTLFKFKLCFVTRFLAADIHCMHSILLCDCSGIIESYTSNTDRDYAIFYWVLSTIYCQLSNWELCFDYIPITSSGNRIYIWLVAAYHLCFVLRHAILRSYIIFIRFNNYGLLRGFWHWRAADKF